MIRRQNTNLFPLHEVRQNDLIYWKVASIKGQVISKWFLGSSISSKKWTNEFNFTTMISQVDLFSFVFWRKSMTPKNHFEINWPLGYFMNAVFSRKGHETSIRMPRPYMSWIFKHLENMWQFSLCNTKVQW